MKDKVQPEASPCASSSLNLVRVFHGKKKSLILPFVPGSTGRSKNEILISVAIRARKSNCIDVPASEMKEQREDFLDPSVNKNFMAAISFAVEAIPFRRLPASVHYTQSVLLAIEFDVSYLCASL